MKKKVSFCLIIRQEDDYFLQEMINTLPDGIELVILKNVINPDLPEYFQLEKTQYYEETDTDTIEAFYRIPELDFSKLKNKCKELASGEWIVNIDCDDRLLYIQSEWTELNNLNKNVGGIVCNVLSQTPRGMSMPIGEVVNTQQVRIFRNVPEFQYKYRVHEDIIPSIIELGYTIFVSTITFKHIGYYTKNTNIILDKYKRNVNLLLKDIAEYNDIRSMILLRQNLNDLHDIGYLK